MAGEGGDTGGSAKGGSGDGGGGFGGDTANYGGGVDNGGYWQPSGGWTASNTGSATAGSDVADYGGGGASAFTSPGEQAGFQGSGTGGLDSFISDPTGGGGNLSGPGPVGGDSGFPGGGGGTNQPTSIGDYSFNNPLDGVSASSFSGTDQPSAVSGVSGTGANPVQTAAGTGASGADSLGGIGATSFAAPGGVAGNPDASTSITNDLDKLTKSPGSTAKTPDGGGGGLLSSLGINGNNGLGAAVAGAGLLNNLIQGNKTTQSMDALRAQAATGNQIAQQLLEQSKPITEKGAGFIDSGKSQVDKGAALQEYVATGKLPEGYELQVTEAINAAKTRAISNAAANGQPTDPKLNTTLAASLDAIDRQGPMLREQLAKDLATTGNSIVGAGNQTAGTGNQLSGNSLVTAGLQATGISSDIYKKLADLDNTQNANRGQAIANFASALNGGGTRGLTLKVA